MAIFEYQRTLFGNNGALSKNQSLILRGFIADPLRHLDLLLLNLVFPTDIGLLLLRNELCSLGLRPLGRKTAGSLGVERFVLVEQLLRSRFNQV